MKKIIYLFLFSFTFLLSSCSSNFELQENDFAFEIAVSQTETKIGEQITVNVTFKNLSNRKIKILMLDGCWQYLENMIQIGCSPNYSNSKYVKHDDYPRYELTLEKGQIIEKSQVFTIEELADYEAMAHIGFYYGRNYGKDMYLKSNSITIKIFEDS